MYVATVIMLAVISTANATPLPDNTTSQQDWTSKSSRGSDDLRQGLCRLKTSDPYVHNKIYQLLADKHATLINYVLNFSNYSHNPLTINMAGVYDAKKWSRVTTAHGQTLLSLAFNYGVLSMMTLTLGTETFHIELQDTPPGCFSAFSDDQKVYCLTSTTENLLRRSRSNGLRMI